MAVQPKEKVLHFALCREVTKRPRGIVAVVNHVCMHAAKVFSSQLLATKLQEDYVHERGQGVSIHIFSFPAQTDVREHFGIAAPTVEHRAWE